jgi:hypothetical protein
LNNSNIDKLDTQKYYKDCNSRSKGTVDERDFIDIIKKDIRFDITNDELDIICDHYSKDQRKGTINYRKFDDDVYAINKREKTKDSNGNKEEEKSKEIAYSLRTSHNIPDDNLYSMKNTVVGRFPDARTMKKHVIKISDTILQDILKATYTRDILVGDAFKRFGKGRT